VRGDTHAGCGERSGETGPWQHRHRAPDRLNKVIRESPAAAARRSKRCLIVSGCGGRPSSKVNT